MYTSVPGWWVVVLCAAMACNPPAGDEPATAQDGASPDAAVVTPVPLTQLAPPQPASEFSGTAFQVPMDAEAFSARLEPLLSASGAREGAELRPLEGLIVAVMPDPRTPAQFVLSVRIQPVSTSGGEPITLAAVPGSLAYAELFVEAAAQAIAADDAERLAGRRVEPWRVAWESRSAHGGRVRLELAGDAAGAALHLAFDTPRVALEADRLNTPAFGGDPRETVSAQVPFALEYASFRSAILGVLGGREGGPPDTGQCDGEDFEVAVAPHGGWYRLCFRQRHDLPNAGEVLVKIRTRDGRELPATLAPGSIESVGLWIVTLDRLIAEVQAGSPGAPRTFTSTYDYRDPDQQGTAIIHASAVDGQLAFSHRFETPPSTLMDTPFVAVPDLQPAVEAPTPCSGVGGEPAASGLFVMRFVASDSLVQFGDTTWPVTGTLYGAIYHGGDVGLTGPIEGAVALQHFVVEDLALGPEPSELAFESVVVPAADYQVTAFLDLDRDSDPADPQPEGGDPVVLPLGVSPLACSRQPLTVEFGLLYPSNR